MMDTNDHEFMPLYNQQHEALQSAFAAALRLYGCVECARLDCAQTLRGLAQEKTMEIIGLDWLNENSMKEDQSEEPPMEKDGIRRVCKHCQEPPPPGTYPLFQAWD